MKNAGQEIRHAARRLWRAPSFAAAAIATLTLAIAANVSMFAVVERVVLNPLPYPDASRLIQLEHAGRVGMSAEVYRVYAARARTLERIAIWDDTEVTLTGGGDPERLRIVRVTPSFGEVLGVAPAYGRWLVEADAAQGAPPVAVLAHSLWMRRFGGDAAVIGRMVTVNGVGMQVVGVTPSDFAFPAPDVQMWINDERLVRLEGLGLVTHAGVARLRNGMRLEDAREELTRLIADVPRAYPDAPRLERLAESLRTAAPIPLKDATIGNVGRALWILLVSVGLVLLVACANVANLFLARSEGRRSEIVVRRALGAGERGIVGFFLSESLLLAALGGVAGLGLAAAAVRLLVATGPATLPRLHEVRLDWIAVLFTLLISAGAGLIMGGIPLLRRAPATLVLRSPAHGMVARRSAMSTRQLLMGIQVALALLLLTVSGLMVRSFQNLRSVDPGFDTSSALTFRLGLPPALYPDHDRIVAGHRAIREQLAALPGVIAVSASNCLPLENERCVSSSLRVEGRANVEGTATPGVLLHGVTADFVDAVGLRLLRGRGIDAADFDTRQPVVVVNQALADAYFPGENPIGRRVTPGSDNDVWGTVIGVVANTPTVALNEPGAVPKLYMPMSATDAGRLGGPNPTNVSYVVRTSAPPLGLLPSVRRSLDAVDADVPIVEPRTLQDVLDRAAAQMAFMMVLLAIAATVSIVLGVVGIYGVTSYIVNQRTAEIGVRVALGARPGAVAAMIVRQCGTVAIAGALLGLALALGGSRFVESLLFRVSPRDPFVLAGTSLLLVAAALLACWLPARRAARLDPVEALRAN